MASLLSCLKADGDEYKKFTGGGDTDNESDEDISNTVERRESMNMVNQSGINF